MKNNTFVTTASAILVIGLLALLGFFIYSRMPADVQEEPQPTPTVQAWVTYTNEEYGFTLQHPADWVVKVDARIPGIHIYKQGATVPDYLTHHNNFTHVSIYPKGIGTEGVMGETAPSTVQFSQKTKNAIDHILENDVRWATMASFLNAPLGWEAWGYIWAGTEVTDEKVECVQGNVIREGVCEIGVEFEDAKTVRSGRINQSDREIQVKILESFQFAP